MSSSFKPGDSVLMSCLDTSCSENMNVSEMKEALTSIAQEIKKFQSSNTSDETTEETDGYKSKLVQKRKQIKSLKENLNTACMIAKTVMTAKESECHSLNSRLNHVRNESVNLLKKNAEHAQTIQRLNLEIHTIKEKYEHLSSFIELGYKELKKIRNEQVHTKNLPVIIQLKEIMLYCGQYYADHRNEHEKCVQLEQKNRYLTNKLSILEANLEGVSEELKKYQRGQKGKSIGNTGKKNNADSRKIGYVCSEYKFGPQVNVSRVTLESDSSQKEEIQKQPLCKVDSIDLTSHISLVNNLLTDQDIMLKDLKALAEELGTLDYEETNDQTKSSV